MTVQLLQMRMLESISPAVWDDFLSLVSHTDEGRRRGGSHWADVELLSRAVYDLSLTKNLLELEFVQDVAQRVSLAVLRPVFVFFRETFQGFGFNC